MIARVPLAESGEREAEVKRGLSARTGVCQERSNPSEHDDHITRLDAPFPARCPVAKGENGRNVRQQARAHLAGVFGLGRRLPLARAGLCRRLVHHYHIRVVAAHYGPRTLRTFLPENAQACPWHLTFYEVRTRALTRSPL
jgi:hypothetical protein